jgi:hypothetical protein
LVVLVCWLLPLLVLIGAGSYWLYREGWLLWWFLGGTVLGLAGWIVARLLTREKSRFPGPEVTPALDWPPVGVAAWQEVEQLARKAEEAPPAVGDWQAWRELVSRTLELVAGHYFPEADQPLLEVSLPRMLRILELVARDLRQAICQHVPLADKLTLGDLRKAQQLQAIVSQLYQLYRIFAVGLNPVQGLSRVLRDVAVQGLQQTTADAVLRWGAGYVVRRTGYYAIMLYGGYLILDEAEFADHQTERSRHQLAEATRELTRVSREPLRILVLGRAAAGKSSVINALAGDVVAPLGVPHRRSKSYPLPPLADGLSRLAVEAPDLDRYAHEHAFICLKHEVLWADVVLVVLRADQSNWDLERRFLEAMQGFYAADPHRHRPPVIVVVTRTDEQVATGARGSPRGRLSDLAGAGSGSGSPEARIEREFGQFADGRVSGCFRPPVSSETTAALHAALRQVENLARIHYVSRVRRSLQSFDLERDLLRPLLTTGKGLVRGVFGWMARGRKPSEP